MKTNTINQILSRPLVWSLVGLLYATPTLAQDGDGTGDGTETTEPESTPAPPKELVEEINVVQRKPFIHTRRSEVMAMAGATANDPFLVHYSAGVWFQHYFSDVLSVGVQGVKYFETSTGLSADVIGLGAVPDLNRLDFYGGVHFSYVPVYGKFALFNQNVVGFDTYVSLGAGLTGNRILAPFSYAKVLKEEDLPVFCGSVPGQGFNDGDDAVDNGAFCETDAAGALINAGDLKPLFLSLSPSFGAGFRFFLNDFMSFSVDAKDFFIQETTLSGQKLFQQNVVVSVGTSFFFPVKFDYRTPR
jgi:outer membrane beta-barrel protein